MFAGGIHHAHDPRLNVIADVADFLDQQRAALDPCQNARGPFDIFKARPRDRHERQRPTVREIMQRPPDQRFARAAFAGDQNRQIRVHHLGHKAIELLHHRRPPDQGQLVRALFDLGGTRGGRAAALFQGARGALHKVRQVKRLGQVIIGLGLGGLDRGHDRVLRRDHDHRQVGPVLTDLGQHLQPVAIGHHHVRDHHIAFALADPAHQRGQRRGRVHLAPGPRQGLCQNGADRAVVIGDQYGAIHQLASSDCFASRISRGTRGNDRRNTVRPGTELTETQPP